MKYENHFSPEGIVQVARKREDRKPKNSWVVSTWKRGAGEWQRIDNVR